jgi:Protein of unknown function (DUF2817)
MSSNSPHPYFASTYAAARAGFLEAVRKRGVPPESHVHPVARGAHDEALAMDAALVGDPDGASLLIVTSATHGVEGFCGSGCQRALLADDELLRRAASGRVAVLLVHAVNPYGFSHLRRANEDNVDLNRNFVDFAAPRPLNQAYAEIHDLLVPREWPPTEANRAALAAREAEMGTPAFRAVVTSGQGVRADGLFYSGSKPTWSNATLREIVRRHGRSRTRIGWIDVHTGLGPTGHGEKIFAGINDPAELARARAWYGADVMSYYDGGSASAEVKGPITMCVYDECPGAEPTGMALEYGTRPMEAVLGAIRGDHWLEIHPDAPPAERAAVKQAMRDAFYVDTDEWRGMVLGQARTAILQAVTALSAPRASG